MAVSAHRLVTDNDGTTGQPIEETCQVAIEGPITIDVQDVGAYTVLCTPEDKRAMAVGFMYSEGIISSLQDIGLLNECLDDPNVIRVRLSDSAAPGKATERNLLIVSSCGICGSESIADKIAAMPKVDTTLVIDPGQIRNVQRDLREKQAIFKQSGGTHAIGIFDNTGRTIAFAEDIGRHNALDKAIGKCLLAGISPAGCGATMSGRISLEMVGKCARAGIEVICAVSAPTSLALDAAQSCNITVIAFARDTRATVFTCPGRVLREG